MSDETRLATAELRRQMRNLRRQLRAEDQRREPLLRWIERLGSAA